MSTSCVHLTECPRNQSLEDQKPAWGRRTSGVVGQFLAAPVHAWLPPPVSSFHVERGVNGPGLQTASTLWWSSNMEWDVGKAPAEPPRSVRLMSSSVCPRHFTGQELTRWGGGVSGVVNLWDGDGGDVHVGAQPLRVLNGVHHPSRLPGAAEPWLTLPSCAFGAVELLHPWVILVLISHISVETNGFVTVTKPGKPLIARVCSLLQVVPRVRVSLWQQEFPGCQQQKGDFC